MLTMANQSDLKVRVTWETKIIDLIKTDNNNELVKRHFIVKER